jgi:FkbM family methyltransferase
LLLGREPDPEGLASHLSAIAKEKITPSELAHRFMQSAEYTGRRADISAQGEILEVPLDGFSLFVRSDDRDIGSHIHAARSYEPHVTAAVRNLLRKGNVFVDVGANIGFFSNMAASIVGDEGYVVCVEPLDKNRQLLFRALERNAFARVRVHSCAASNRAGIISIITDPGTSNGQPLPAGVSSRNALYAQTERLDDLTADLRRIDLVKMDIDGYEILAWDGFRSSLEKHRPMIVSEFHPYGMRKFVGVDPLEYLAELFGYGETVQVLEFEGGRTTCKSPGEVMRRWELVNASMQSEEGKVHLDLLVQPRMAGA